MIASKTLSAKATSRLKTQSGRYDQYDLEAEEANRCPRQHPRFDTHIRALLYCRGKFQTTTIDDISQGGIGLTGALGILQHDNVTLQLLNGREIKGTVRWWFNGRAGVAFHSLLAADDLLLLTAASRSVRRLPPLRAR